MTPALAVFPILLAMVQIPQPVDSFRALARHGSDSALIEGVRRGPMEARSAWRQLLALVRGNEDSAALAALAAAERIAGAVAVAWQDSFLVRQVARFRSLSPAERQATVEADSLWRAGRAALGTQSVMEMVRETLRRFEALADTSGIAGALLMVGVSFFEDQKYDSAAAYIAQSQGHAEQIGDFYLLAAGFLESGYSRFRQGDFPSARASLMRARELFERIGDTGNVRNALNGLGLVAWEEDDFAEARASFEMGLALSRRAHDARHEALFLANLGGLAATAGEYADAAGFLGEAVSHYRAQERPLRVAATLRDLGAVALRRGDYPEAVKILSEAAGIFRGMGLGSTSDEIDEIATRSELAAAQAAMGDLARARTELAQAEAVARRLPGASRRASLTDLALARGDLALRFNRLRRSRTALRARPAPRAWPDSGMDAWSGAGRNGHRIVETRELWPGDYRLRTGLESGISR